VITLGKVASIPPYPPCNLVLCRQLHPTKERPKLYNSEVEYFCWSSSQYLQSVLDISSFGKTISSCLSGLGIIRLLPYELILKTTRKYE
jgi:hypothetical protein